MSMDRCAVCNSIVDTDNPDDCRYLSYGDRDDRCVCDNCLPSISVCQRCGFVCEPVEHEETEVSEAWGARQVERVKYLLSDCCCETVEEVE
jgi:hypothetical protein